MISGFDDRDFSWQSWTPSQGRGHGVGCFTGYQNPIEVALTCHIGADGLPIWIAGLVGPLPQRGEVEAHFRRSRGAMGLSEAVLRWVDLEGARGAGRPKRLMAVAEGIVAYRNEGHTLRETRPAVVTGPAAHPGGFLFCVDGRRFNSAMVRELYDGPRLSRQKSWNWTSWMLPNAESAHSSAKGRPPARGVASNPIS